MGKAGEESEIREEKWGHPRRSDTKYWWADFRRRACRIPSARPFSFFIYQINGPAFPLANPRVKFDDGEIIANQKVGPVV
jgi:hypothetical protein